MSKGPHLVVLNIGLLSREPLLQSLNVLKTEFAGLGVTDFSAEGGVRKLEGQTDGIIINSEEWLPAYEKLVFSFRDNGYRGPMLILAKTPASFQPPTSRAFDKIVFLNRPYNEKEMIGLVRRMVLAPLVAARQFPRIETNLACELTLTDRPGIFSAVVKNLSKGGCFIELAKALHVRIGDEVNLRIHFVNPKRSIEAKGRIAWTKGKGNGYGVQFMLELES